LPPNTFDEAQDDRFDRPDRRGRPGRLPPENSARITRRITALAVIVGLALTIAKVFLWQHSHSVGVMASLVHSGLDMFGAMSSFIAVRTIWLIIAQSWAIRATGSIAVRGDRAHYTADLFANLFVIIGLILATFTSWVWADAVVGGIMALWLFYTIKRIAMSDPRIRAINELRTRASGPHIHIQMRLDMDEHLSLSDAHDIVLQCEQRLMADFQAADIVIHPHPAGCKHTHGNKRFFIDSSSVN